MLVPCLLFSTLTLGGCEDAEAENSDLVLENETENVEEINVEEIKEGDVKIFAPREHMFAKQQYISEILQYDGYEVFDIESLGYSSITSKQLIVTYVNTVEVEAVASLTTRDSCGFNTPGIPTQKEQENQKVYTK